jgi:hypothetical protein
MTDIGSIVKADQNLEPLRTMRGAPGDRVRMEDVLE